MSDRSLRGTRLGGSSMESEEGVEFAARRINLSNLFSRPTKAGGLGDYCFIIYADGHVTDELVADTMRSLHAKQGGVKFLGSYPAAGESAAS